MTEFSVVYGFQQITSSPHYPKSNGLAERTIQTIKTLLEKSTDPFLALLSHRATTLQWCGLSPSELLMGRRIRTTLPQVTQHLIPNWSFLKSFCELDNKYKSVHTTGTIDRPLPELTEDTPVWIRTENSQQSGRIVSASGEPRSYIVSTPTGQVRRNRHHMVPIPKPAHQRLNLKPNLMLSLNEVQYKPGLELVQ